MEMTGNETTTTVSSSSLYAPAHHITLHAIGTGSEATVELFAGNLLEEGGGVLGVLGGQAQAGDGLDSVHGADRIGCVGESELHAFADPAHVGLRNANQASA